jgi:hypothetical protein
MLPLDALFCPCCTPALLHSLLFISRHGTVNYPAIEQALRKCQVEPTASKSGFSSSD